MIADSAPLTDADIERLARLHRLTMPHSVLSHMGLSTLGQYYVWVAESQRERLFVSREGATIVGAAVLSLSPDSVMRRFIAARPIGFLARAVAAFVQDTAFRADVRGFLLERDAPASGNGAEVLQIFVAPERQLRRAGTELLERVEAWLKAAGIPRYCVRTLAERNDATLAFYGKRGFQRRGESRFCGASYRVLEKVLA